MTGRGTTAQRLRSEVRRRAIRQPQPEPPAAAPPLAGVEEPYVDSRHLARLMGISLRSVEKLKAEGMPCESWGRRAIRFQPSVAIAWAREHATVVASLPPVDADLTPHDVANLSAISYWTVLAEIRRGHLRAYERPGGRKAIRRDDYQAWAYGTPVQPDQPLVIEEPRLRSTRRRGTDRLDELERQHERGGA